MPQVLGKEYKNFRGNSNYIVLMPKLIKAGLVPMNIADVMKARLESAKYGTYKQKCFWLYNDFDTADGVAYYKGKIKIVHDARALRDIQQYTELNKGALVHIPEQYRNLEGEEFSVHDLEKAGINKWLTKSKVKSHPIWKSLARDNDLLYEYADFVFAEVKKTYGSNKAMGIYLGFEQKKPTMMAWHIEEPHRKSNASGFKGLNDFTHLVGVSAEGASPKETLDEKVLNALKVGQTFEFNGQLYAPVSKNT